MSGAHDAVVLADELSRRVLAPLLGGGRVEPLPPIGSALALRAVEHDLPLSSVVESAVMEHRLRAARTLFPVDALPRPGRAEWLLGFALNDLLQVTNPELARYFGRERPKRLVDMAARLVNEAGAPATVQESLARHGTFSRLFELTRLDTKISWWVGSETFRGQTPPARLTAWPELRRVRSSQEEVQLGEMLTDERHADPWFEVMSRLCAASPLTSLAWVNRRAPQFQWTGALLGLIQSPIGYRLALRAIERHADVQRAAQTLGTAAKAIEVKPARKCARAFANAVVELAKV